MSTTLKFPADTSTRCRGSLLGLAVGDALGTTLEFKSPGTFQPLQDMVGSGPFGLKPGQWTDDTSMALCLGESLLACKGFDARDQDGTLLPLVERGLPELDGNVFRHRHHRARGVGPVPAGWRPVRGFNRPADGGQRLADALGSGAVVLRQSGHARGRGTGGGEFARDPRGRGGGRRLPVHGGVDRRHAGRGHQRKNYYPRALHPPTPRICGAYTRWTRRWTRWRRVRSARSRTV